MFETASGRRPSRGTPMEGTAPIRLTMSENRSSSVIFCSVSRAISSGDGMADLGDFVCAIAGRLTDSAIAAEPATFATSRRVMSPIIRHSCRDRQSRGAPAVYFCTGALGLSVHRALGVPRANARPKVEPIYRGMRCPTLDADQTRTVRRSLKADVDAMALTVHDGSK